MASKVEIVNRALAKLGAGSITSMDDETEEARTASRFYATTLKMVLSETLWVFSEKRALLQTTTDTIAFNNDKEALTHVYQVPTDVIRIFRTNDDGQVWHQVGDKIYADQAGFGIIYTYYNQNTPSYSPSFVEALSDKLAYDMSFSMINSASTTKKLGEAYEMISLSKAMSHNAQTGTPKEVNDNYWLNARYGGPKVQEFQ